MKIFKITTLTYNKIPIYYRINDDRSFNYSLVGVVDYILKYDRRYVEELSVSKYEINGMKFLTLNKNNLPMLAHIDIQEEVINLSIDNNDLIDMFNEQERIILENNIGIIDNTNEPYIKLVYLDDKTEFFIKSNRNNNNIDNASHNNLIDYKNYLKTIEERNQELKKKEINSIDEIDFGIKSFIKDFNKLKSTDHLYITEGTLPNTQYLVSVWNIILSKYGVNMSISKINKLFENTSKSIEQISNIIESVIKEKLFIKEDNVYIDYNSRKLNDFSLANYLVKLGMLEGFFLKRTSTKVSLEMLTEIVKKYPSDSWQSKLAFNIHELLKLKDLKSDLSKFMDTASSYKYSEKDSYKGDIRDDNLIVYPSSNLLTTNRIQIIQPNLQGLQPKIKECIGYSDKSRSIISMDIKGQDTHVLIFGVLKDDELTKATKELGDPILGLLKRLDYPTTPYNRKIGKLPVLGLMNGKALNTILTNDVETDEDKAMVTDIYNFITTNENYSRLVDIANNKLVKGDYTKSCLLGVTNELNLYDKKGSKRKNYTLKNAILNANFQMTSASIFNLSTIYFINDLLNGNIRFGDEVITIDMIRPCVPIFDEIVFDCKAGYEEKAKKIMEYYFLPQVLDWEDTMKNEITQSEFYIHK